MIYLASPYTHPDSNIEYLRYKAVYFHTLAMIKNGFGVFSPILYGYQFHVKGDLKGDFAQWENLNKMMIEKAEVVLVLMLDGWQTSAGVTTEIKYAQELGKRIQYVQEQEFPEMAEIH